jgi:hypothetical protein
VIQNQYTKTRKFGSLINEVKINNLEPIMWYNKSFETHCDKIIKNIISKKLQDKYYIQQIISENNKGSVISFKILDIQNFIGTCNNNYLMLKQYSQNIKSEKLVIEEFKDLEIDLIAGNGCIDLFLKIKK